MMTPEEQLDIIKRIKAIADMGLVYVDDPYDKERYEELREISLKLMAHQADVPFSKIDSFFIPQLDYPTPKVDVRGFVLNDKNEILMAKESVDNKWTIPGGWADIGNTPKEVVIKEIKEETGIDAEVVRLLAIYDKQRHKHPAEPYYIYKLMFFCKATGGELQPGFDMRGADYFPLHNLPELSEERILESQLKHLYKLVANKVQEVYVD